MSIATEIQRLQQAKADIKAAIEEKGVNVGDETIDAYADKISEISGGSGDNPLEYVNSLYESYYGVTFPNDYELTLNVPNITSLNSAFYNAKGIKKITIKGNTAGNNVVFNRAFRSCASVETIDLTEFNVIFATDLTMMCAYNTNLKYILGELDFSNVTGGLNNAFEGANNLVTITPKANSIKISLKFAYNNKLSDASIQSIIDGLADLSGLTSQTLTVHQDVRNKLTDDQLTTISDKNWAISPAEATN